MGLCLGSWKGANLVYKKKLAGERFRRLTREYQKYWFELEKVQEVAAAQAATVTSSFS